MWHGPTINFFLWGLLNGIILVIEKLCKYDPKNKLFIILNYFIVSCLWIFFIYEDFGNVLSNFVLLFKFGTYDIFNINYLSIMNLTNYIILFISILFLGYIEWKKYNQKEFVFKYRNRDYILFILFIFVIILFGVYGIGFNQADFIYNRF
jgi:hypothetical protein